MQPSLTGLCTGGAVLYWAITGSVHMFQVTFRDQTMIETT